MFNIDKIDLIPVSEVCDRLMISEHVAYNLLRSGELEAFRIGKIWKIPSDSIDKYIRKKCNEKQE